MNERGGLRVVGVLGGMGPEAMMHPMSRVIAPAPSEDDADHPPLLVDHNPQMDTSGKALLYGR